MAGRSKIHHSVVFGILMIPVILLMTRCANPVSPQGGPKDVTPPTLVKAYPPMYTRNFNAEKIKLTFSEFIQLKDLTKQLIISPPMLKTPEVRLKGKSVVIVLKEELKENTTYNIFFGNAIIDLTENNPALNFRYIFSTGDILDSLSIKGSINDAFDLTAEEGINIMLYLNNNDTVPFDSLPYVVKPYYMTKSDAAGDYLITNLPNKSFKLFALADGNANLIYDQPTEKIAFVEKPVKPYYIPVALSDSLVNDSLVTDTVQAKKIDNELEEIPEFKLALFTEKDTVQRFIKAFLAKKGQVDIIFKLPTINPEVVPLNLPEGYDWSLHEANNTKDTLIYWLKDIDKDSLKLKISEKNMNTDTVDVAIVKRSRGRKAKEEENKIPPLEIKSNVRGSADLNNPVSLTFSYPVIKSDISGMLFIEQEDTMKAPFSFTDSIKRIGIIDHVLKPATTYELVIPDSAFIDLQGSANDSVVLKFKTKALEDIGNFYLEAGITDTTFNYIIQLLEKDKIVKEMIIHQGQKLSFKYLIPSTYRLKVIYDRNKNRRWDTGNYPMKIQPEEVKFFQKDIVIRANWDVEETWDL